MWLGSEERLRTLQGRTAWLLGCTGAVFFVLLLRLFYLQAVRGSFYEALARENKIVSEIIPGPRGKILDRWGRIIVDNRPSFSVYVFPESLQPRRRDPAATARREKKIRDLAWLIRLDPESITQKINGARGRERFKPLAIKRDVSWEEVSRLEEAGMQGDGVFIRSEPMRQYPFGGAAVHLLGYVHEVNPDELSSWREKYPKLGYRQGAIVGKAGVEAQAEPLLHPRDGHRQIILDASGSEVGADVLKELNFEAVNQESAPGADVELTLDWDLQLYAEEVLGEKAGAVVALEPQYGGILALVSHPGFDPAVFAKGVTPEDYAKLLNDPARPLYSKTIQGQYPPGSTYKVFVAMAGLEENILGPSFRPVCGGHLRFGRRDYRCWKGGGHGAVDLHKAIRESCDVYFYRTGIALGVDKMAYYSNLFGLGQKTGVDLPDEKPGLIPSSEWKLKARKQVWLPGETLSCSIGQGFVLATPLQMARATAAIATSGRLPRPHVLRRALDPAGGVVKDFETESPVQLPLSAGAFQQVRAGMAAVVQEPHGTGGAARLPKTLVAGKTGTAQVVHLETTENLDDDEIPEEWRDHAWFISYAPADSPNIVVVVLVEHGGHGGAAAAPLAGRIIGRYQELLQQRAAGPAAPADGRRYAETERPGKRPEKN